MTEFLCFSNGEVDHRSKFIRIGERIFVTEPNETRILHSELADQENVLEEINGLLKTDAESLDFGFITTRAYSQFREILISGSTISIEVSRESREEARKITGDIIEKMCPDFKVHIIR